MELLVATLAHLNPGREADGAARIRLIAETIRNAPTQVNVQCYQSRGHDAYYFMLVTWEDEKAWQQARERYDPKALLLGSATELLAQTPEQWFMRYLWGYSRPASKPSLAAVHLAIANHNQGELAQRGWIESLRRQVVQPTLAFAFLARGTSDNRADTPGQITAIGNNAVGPWDVDQGSIFLNFLSWANETDREEFYADPNYRAISRFLSSIGVVQALTLEAL
jgi:quinol monooxygenase YgiN